MVNYPKAFIFDLDGVITDTAEFHFLAWKKLAEDLGITIDRAFNETLKGISRMDSLERILELAPSLQFTLEEKTALTTLKNEHYRELIGTITPEHILPGIQTLLEKIKAHGIRITPGSASKNATMVLEQLELTHYFDYIVDAAKVSKGKPDPETFLTAVEHLDVSSGECIGVEDAAAGVEAIRGANMFAVGVGAEEQLFHSHYRVDKTSDLSFEEIIEQYNSQSRA